MKLTGWQLVAVIGLVLASVVILAGLGRDTTAMIGLATLILGGLGLIVGGQQGIRDQANGNVARMLAMLESQSRMLAATQPVPPERANIL